MEKRRGVAYQTLPGCAARGTAQQQPTNEAQPKTKTNPDPRIDSLRKKKKNLFFPNVDNAQKGLGHVPRHRFEPRRARLVL
jgi:hypothetical protein